MDQLLVIGSLNMDMVLDVPSIPRPGETLMGALTAYVPGGKGANQACAAGRIGGKTAMLGMTGDDAFGRQLRGSLDAAGVDTGAIGLSAQPTGQAVINVARSGENSIVVLPGANGTCDVQTIRDHEALFEGSRVVLLQMEIPHDAVWEAIRLAKRHGCTVVLNPAPAPDSLPVEILPLIDYLIPNETELERLCAPITDRAAAAASLLNKGVRHVIVTVGKDGAELYTQGDTLFQPSFPVQAVDTTAAGDTFCGVFATLLSEGAPLSDCLEYAAAAAAISVTRPGAQTSIPARDEVEALLKR